VVLVAAPMPSCPSPRLRHPCDTCCMPYFDGRVVCHALMADCYSSPHKVRMLCNMRKIGCHPCRPLPTPTLLPTLRPQCNPVYLFLLNDKSRTPDPLLSQTALCPLQRC
jgi:hypothetical protein